MDSSASLFLTHHHQFLHRVRGVSSPRVPQPRPSNTPDTCSQAHEVEETLSAAVDAGQTRQAAVSRGGNASRTEQQVKRALCGAHPTAAAFPGDTVNDCVWLGLGAAGAAVGSPRTAASL